jgi:hypothetical protein
MTLRDVKDVEDITVTYRGQLQGQANKVNPDAAGLDGTLRWHR